MNETTLILNKVLDTASLRHKVLANNLANASTPGFKRQDVDFQSALKSAIETGSKEAIEKVQPRVVEDTSVASRPDGNSVSTHIEMTQMTENSLLYDFATKALSAKYARMKSAIKGQ